MRPLRFPLLTDENIHGEVVRSLHAQGWDIHSVFEEGLCGRADVDILRHAHARGWVVVTHDSDFGTLAVRQGEPYTGIIYLRPGHILPAFVLELLSRLDALGLEVTPPFIIVAERRTGQIRLRIRDASQGE
jgi:predicted nuclease of predicted toxin-antitoxin system